MCKRVGVVRVGGLILAMAAAALICEAHEQGRMTGGGSFFQGDMRITHGFELHCGTNDSGTDIPGPNNLEINWGGNRFHLESMIFAVCTLDGDPRPPAAPFTDYDAAGMGRYNGTPGYRASWRFTDYGEPGRDDLVIRMTIVGPTGDVVLNLTAPVTLTFGNHQAHKD